MTFEYLVQNFGAKLLYSYHFLGYLIQNSYYFLVVFAEMASICETVPDGRVYLTAIVLQSILTMYLNIDSYPVIDVLCQLWGNLVAIILPNSQLQLLKIATQHGF